MAVRDETRMLLETMQRLFEDMATKQVADASETGKFAADLWAAVAETGVPHAALPESAGGADAEWEDLYYVLRVAGRFSAPIPLAETMLAGWVAASAGLDTVDGPMTVGPVRATDVLTLTADGNGWRLNGTASRLPYATSAERIILIADGPDGEMAVALDGTAGATVAPGKNIANEARDTLTFDNLRLEADAARPLGAGVSRAALYRRGALARATMMSGAMENAMDLACTYAQQRVQFGRPISKFQAVCGGEKTLADFDHLNKGTEVLLDEFAWWVNATKAARARPSKGCAEKYRAMSVCSVSSMPTARFPASTATVVLKTHPQNSASLSRRGCGWALSPTAPSTSAFSRSGSFTRRISGRNPPRAPIFAPKR